MKSNFNKFLAVLFLIILFNCTNENVSPVNNIENISEQKINTILNMSSESDRRLAYDLLNKNEKFSIWKNKMESLINENKLFGVTINLTEEQLKLISELNNNLEPYLFSKEQNDKKEFYKNVYVPKFIEKAKLVFDNNYVIGMIFYELTLVTDVNLKQDLENAELEDLIDAFNRVGVDGFDDGFQPKDCDCNKDSFFSCKWGEHDVYCKDTNCKSSLDGCGFLGWYECDQECKF